MEIDARTARLKKLRMRSWRRGTKEMDMILGPFADARLSQLDGPTLDAYEAMMSENDQDLYLWVSGKQSAPSTHDPILQIIRAYHNI